MVLHWLTSAQETWDGKFPSVCPISIPAAASWSLTVHQSCLELGRVTELSQVNWKTRFLLVNRKHRLVCSQKAFFCIHHVFYLALLLVWPHFSWLLVLFGYLGCGMFCWSSTRKLGMQEVCWGSAPEIWTLDLAEDLMLLNINLFNWGGGCLDGGRLIWGTALDKQVIIFILWLHYENADEG